MSATDVFCGALLAIPGWIEDRGRSRKYRVFAYGTRKSRLLVGKRGAVRLAVNGTISDSWSIGTVKTVSVGKLADRMR